MYNRNNFQNNQNNNYPNKNIFNINNNINNNIYKDLNQNKKSNNDLDQALSLNDKFIFKDIELEPNNNNLFFYVPEENIQGLCSINIEPYNKIAKCKYLKHFSTLGNKRNNTDIIQQNFNDINAQPKNVVENGNFSILFKNIFENRKNFYGNNEIKKNLNKDYYITFINDILNKDKLLSKNNIDENIENFNNYIYNNYKSMDKLSLNNISSCYFKERNIKNNFYFTKKNIIINSLFFLINEKINQMTKNHQEEIVFVGESGIGKSYSLYLYTYLLRLNPFNLVISIFEIEEFLEDPCLYLQKEIAYSLYYVCAKNSEIDLKYLYDCLINDKDNKKMNYEILLEKFKFLVSLLFQAYDNKLSLYIIIDRLEKIEKNIETINKLVNSLYSIKIKDDGNDNKEFEERFKVIFFCNSDEANSDFIIKEKFKEFSYIDIFSKVNYSDFFEQGIIFLEPEIIFDKKEIKYFIDKNIINKQYINNKDDEDIIMNNIIEYTNSNFKKILWIIKDDKILSNIKESKSVQYYIRDNLDEWLFNKIFQFDKFSAEENMKIYHFIYSCQNIKEMSEILTTNFFVQGYKAYNYSLIIPQIIKNKENFYITFKLKNKNLTILLKYLDMDKLYKKISLNNISLECLIKEYSETKSAILRGLIIEEMAFIIFKNAVKEKNKIILNFNVLIFAKSKEYLLGNSEKNNQKSVAIGNVQKSMSREDDIFEREYFFTNEINEENDGIYFLSHKFPCIDCVIKNGKEVYLIQIKKTLLFEHILQINEDMHYLYLLIRDENIFNELVRQNELKLAKNKLNTKLNFFIKLAKIYKKKFNYSFHFMFVYQAKENSLDINQNNETKIKNIFELEKREISYKLEDKWKGPLLPEMYYINYDYFLKIKCSLVWPNILLTSIDNFTADLQKLLKISKNEDFFCSLKE